MPWTSGQKTTLSKKHLAQGTPEKEESRILLSGRTKAAYTVLMKVTEQSIVTKSSIWRTEEDFRGETIVSIVLEENIVWQNAKARIDVRLAKANIIRQYAIKVILLKNQV